jgi:hypothetical protein
MRQLAECICLEPWLRGTLLFYWSSERLGSKRQPIYELQCMYVGSGSLVVFVRHENVLPCWHGRKV